MLAAMSGLVAPHALNALPLVAASDMLTSGCKMDLLIRFVRVPLGGQLTPVFIFVDGKMACAARATGIGSTVRRRSSPVTRCLRTNVMLDVGETHTFVLGGIGNVAPNDRPEFILPTCECVCRWNMPVRLSECYYVSISNCE